MRLLLYAMAWHAAATGLHAQALLSVIEVWVMDFGTLCSHRSTLWPVADCQY